MTMQSAAPPDQSARRARGAVAALFLTNGALFANLLPRLPEIKAALGIENAAYGLAVAAFPAGAIVAGLGAAVLIRRFGSGRVAVLGTLLTGAAVLAAGLAPSLALFAFAMFLGGAFDAITDVGQNAHGLRVQRRYGRSIINSFHALWSIGSVVGGAMAAGAIVLDVPIGVHLSVSGVGFAVVALVALRFTLPGRDEDAGESVDEGSIADGGQVQDALRAAVGARTVLVLAALVGIGIAGAIVEDAGNSWATLYLAESLQASPAVAATGFIALVGAQFVGRMLGDRMVDRFGQRAVARAGGLIAAAGMGLALAFPTVPGTIAGFAAAGFGVATLVPAAMSEADALPGLRHGTGLTIVSWLMRLGFLLSPPLVGLVADVTELRLGLLVVPIAGGLVVLLAGVLHGRTGHQAPRDANP
ncbi:MAG: MFS transporter [Cellulomonadaceae bacterium]